jgi:hypothetical protein
MNNSGIRRMRDVARSRPFHLLRPDELQVSPQPGFRMAVMRLSSLALPMGTKGWPRRSRTDPRCGVATAKEITYVKDGRFVRLGPRFR